MLFRSIDRNVSGFIFFTGCKLAFNFVAWDFIEQGQTALKAIEINQFARAIFLINELLDDLWLQTRRRPLVKLYDSLTHFAFNDFDLNDSQKQAVSDVLARHPGHTLIQGVTGSGKTEIYLHLARVFLNQGNTEIGRAHV